ncbi:hypothetical protein BUALT_Bualt02G0076900 [Buddleja alternifolia]|uniref:Reticulon-like protein n=1 Tax=Buddleja alternifolia TaxID=168488 RepID=A0AAV6XYT9_9LAMI|nr:hypothetical protein BUALT_Bualt02G0076900 [Buddleja alternifolia]
MDTSSDSDINGSMLPVRLFGRQRPIHAVLGGGKVGEFAVGDVVLWRDTRVSGGIVMGISAIWFLFEVVEYNLVTLLCHLFITTMLLIFIWSSAAQFFNWCRCFSGAGSALYRCGYRSIAAVFSGNLLLPCSEFRRGIIGGRCVLLRACMFGQDKADVKKEQNVRILKRELLWIWRQSSSVVVYPSVHFITLLVYWLWNPFDNDILHQFCGVFFLGLFFNGGRDNVLSGLYSLDHPPLILVSGSTDDDIRTPLTKDASNVGKDTLDQSTDADAYVVPPDDCPSPTFGSAASAIAIGTFLGADVAASVVHSPDRLTTVDATASEHSQLSFALHSQLSFAPAAAKGRRRLFLKDESDDDDAPTMKTYKRLKD